MRAKHVKLSLSPNLKERGLGPRALRAWTVTGPAGTQAAPRQHPEPQPEPGFIPGRAARPPRPPRARPGAECGRGHVRSELEDTETR